MESFEHSPQRSGLIADPRCKSCVRGGGVRVYTGRVRNIELVPLASAATENGIRRGGCDLILGLSGE